MLRVADELVKVIHALSHAVAVLRIEALAVGLGGFRAGAAEVVADRAEGVAVGDILYWPAADVVTHVVSAVGVV